MIRLILWYLLIVLVMGIMMYGENLRNKIVERGKPDRRQECLEWFFGYAPRKPKEED